ncbi:chaperone protein DnaJ-like isoform X4 [Panicum virgatum]|nr:chaperone protein DnaJ-like isoform X4 [Panicum virgatum]
MSATALFLPANPNPTPRLPCSFRQTTPASTSDELHFRLRLPRHARARTRLPAAFGRGSPAAGRGEKKDYYATLNIRRDASLQEVKAAYRTLARKYHPDMNKSPGAEEKFKEISAAYEILSDEDKRSLYDRSGEEGLYGDYVHGDIGTHGIDPYELFNAFFGGSDKIFGDSMAPGEFHYSAEVNDNRGLDISYDLLLSFEESILGGKQEINIFRQETCGTCHGTGAKSSNGITECTRCRGQGRLMKTQRTPFGIVSQISSCLNCGGSGKIITEHCTECHGSGKAQVERSIEVDIPGGIADGSTIRVRGGGSVDKQRGASGDLYIFIRVNEKQGIYRDGLNLYSDISVDYTDAILGTTVKVETVEGFMDLRIPSGTQPGENLKVSQLGVPDIRRPNVRGDHYFMIK